MVKADMIQRFVTALVVIPSLFFLLQTKIGGFCVVIYCSYQGYCEWQGISGHIIDSLVKISHINLEFKNFLLIRVPMTLYLVLVYFTDDYELQKLWLFLTILIIFSIRIVQFLNNAEPTEINISLIDKKDQQVDKNLQDKKEYYVNQVIIICFCYIALDIVGFILFIYPFGFALNTIKIENGYKFVILWLSTSFQTDNGALFVGKALGRTKFSPKISKNKTWEGVLGAITTSTISVVIFSKYSSFFFDLYPVLPQADCIKIGLICSVISVLGDLFESFIKRAAGVKDSGDLFPGHGGMLDRLDSLTFSAPLFFTYINLYCKDILVQQ